MTQFVAVAVAVAVDKKNVAKWLGNCYCGRQQRTGNALSQYQVKNFTFWSEISCLS